MKKITLAILLGFSLIACRKEKAFWESNWSLPLVSDTLDLKNLVTDSIFSVNTSGNYQLEINRNVVDIKLSDYIQLPDTVVKQKYALGINSISVNPGTSFLSNNKDHVIDMKDAELKAVRISRGSIEISVSNPFSTKTIFTIQLPKAKKNGVTISRQFSAPAGTLQNPSIVSATIDLAGYDLDLRGTGNVGFNLLQSEMNVQSDPNGNAIVVTKYDSTSFTLHMRDIQIDYARGYFGQLSVVDSSDLNVDFLEKITGGTLDIPSTNISFLISNGIKVAARANIQQVKNKNIHTGNTVSLSHNQIGIPLDVSAATGSWNNFIASLKTISFTSGNSNIEQYIENLGSIQKINYSLKLNPYGNISGGWDEFFPNSNLKVKMVANMPLSLSLSNLTFQDTFKIDLKNDKNKSHLISGKIKLKTSNAFPLEGAVQLFLLDASGQVIETITASEKIGSSIFGAIPNPGELQKNNSTVYFDLTAASLLNLNKVKNIVVKAVMNTPDQNQNSTIISIPDGAFVSFKLSAAFQTENRL
jgi:hypothetical protein